MIISDLVYGALQSLDNVYQSTYLKDLDVTGSVKKSKNTDELSQHEKSSVRIW